MVSKKEAIILGVALVGGLGLASMMSQDVGGAGTEARYRALPGGILGSGDTPDAAPAAGPSIFNIPADSFTGFPQQTEPQWLKQFLQPQPEPVGTVSTPKKLRGTSGARGSGRGGERGLESSKESYKYMKTAQKITYKGKTYTKATSPPKPKKAVLSAKAKTFRRVVGKVHPGYSNSGGD